MPARISRRTDDLHLAVFPRNSHNHNAISSLSTSTATEMYGAGRLECGVRAPAGRFPALLQYLSPRPSLSPSLRLLCTVFRHLYIPRLPHARRTPRHHRGTMHPGRTTHARISQRKHNRRGRAARASRAERPCVRPPQLTRRWVQPPLTQGAAPSPSPPPPSPSPPPSSMLYTPDRRRAALYMKVDER